MPIEFMLLSLTSAPFAYCPKCGKLFYPFLRGEVQRRRYKYFFFGDWPYCAIICSECKEIVGYENPYTQRWCYA